MGGEDGCDGSWGIYFLYRTQMICKKKRTTALKQYQADFPWTENKEVFCFRSSVSSTRTLSGILEPITFWTNYQFIWSGKVYIWLSVWQFQKLFLWQPCINKVMHVENWETDQLQHDLNVDISYKFTQCEKESLQILDFQRLASLDYVLQQVQTLSLL